MAYESRTQEEILKELQEWSATAAAEFEGTFEYDVFSSNAIEFQKIELELEEVYQASFDNAGGSCREFGKCCRLICGTNIYFALRIWRTTRAKIFPMNFLQKLSRSHFQSAQQ